MPIPSTEQIQKAIDGLVEKGLVEVSTMPDGRPGYKISEKGRSALEEYALAVLMDGPPAGHA